MMVMATVRPFQTLFSSSRPRCNIATSCRPFLHARYSVSSVPKDNQYPYPSFANGAYDEVARLAATRRRPLTLADLLKYV